MKLGVGVIGYNDREGLERCLNSLSDFFPVIYRDGRWNDFLPSLTNHRSNDDSIELAESYSNVTVIEGIGLEPKARNDYIIQFAKWGCDCIFWVDTDEYVELPLGYDFFIKGLEERITEQPEKLSFHLHFTNDNEGKEAYTSTQRRMIVNPMFTRHRDRHNQLWYMDQEVLGHNTGKPIRGLILHQNKSHRTKEREIEMKRRNLANPRH